MIWTEGRKISIGSIAASWLKCCWQLILGVASGTALFFLCVVALASSLSFWAMPMGSLLALAIWIAIVTTSAVRMHSRGWNPARIEFLAGLGVVPCYTGISMIIGMSVEGLW